MNSALLLPLVMIFANAVGLLTQAFIPHFLPPNQYSTFSALWAYGQFCSVLAFEWLRLSILRFSAGADVDVAKQRQNVIKRSLVAICAVLIAVSGCLVAVRMAIELPLWAPLLSFYACCQGLFDCSQARSRALSLHRRFILTWSLRSILSLVLSLFAAYASRSSEWTLLALALSYPVALLAFASRSLPNVGGAKIDMKTLTFLAHFGMFMAMANAIGLFFPALVRTMALIELSQHNAGGLSLAFDFLQKVVGLSGLAVNIIVSQQSFRSAEFDTEEGRRDQIKRQILIPTSFILLCVIGFTVLQPAMATFFIPASYLTSYLASVNYAAAACAVIAIRMYAIDPLFVMSGDTKSAIVGPIATLAITAAAIWGIGRTGLSSLAAVGIGALIGATTGCLLAYLMIRRRVPMPTIGRELIVVGGACCFSIAATFSLQAQPTIWEIATKGGIVVLFIVPAIWIVFRKDVTAARRNRR
jgi:hypothetical protein